ncbi:MAG: PAS domain S-box protein [Gemmatimonadota bacterium]
MSNSMMVRPSDVESEVLSLIRGLHDTEIRLKELTASEVDAVVHPTGRSYLLHEAQQQLIKSEAVQHRLAETQLAIINALPAHVALLDSEGAIVSVNDAWKRFAGVSTGGIADAGVGDNYLEVCDRASTEWAAEAHSAAVAIRAVLAGVSHPETIEFPAHSPDGERWFGLMVAPLAGDRNAGAVMMHVDLTERRLTEETLRRQRTELRLLFDLIPAMIWFKDTNNRIVRLNKRAAELAGKSVEEIEGKAFSDVYPSQSARSFLDSSEVIRLGRAKLGVVDTLRNRDGKKLWLQTDKVPSFDKAGNVIGIVVVAQDVTQQRRADDRLREQASLLDKAQDAILVRDLDNRITFWNKGAERLYGWSVEEAVGRIESELLYGEPNAAGGEAWKRVMDHGEWVGELLQVDKQGRDLIIEGRWTLVRDDTGQPQRVLAINTDLTERKQLEQQYFRAQRLESIGTLAGGIAHDLNNMLAPIIMSVDLLKMTVTDPEDCELLETIGASARRGAEMVSQVLSFARGMEGRRVELGVKHLVHDLEKIVRDTFPKNIHIRTLISRDLWTVLADPTQLHQVLLNLCVNARDAMPAGGTIVITAENVSLDTKFRVMNDESQSGPHISIQVEDGGLGISKAVLEKIFDPFFTTKALGKGTGLGLSTSLAIIKGHGGFIRVYSEEGKGTRFRIYLPAHTAPSAPTLADDLAELPRGRGEVVLVVDDEASIRQVARQTLETFGYRVLVASDGAEALTVFGKHQSEIAVVLTDMMMPGMDGSSTIEKLIEMNPSVRIVAASGLSANGDIAKALGENVKHFLQKPYTAESLLNALRHVLA